MPPPEPSAHDSTNQPTRIGQPPRRAHGPTLTWIGAEAPFALGRYVIIGRGQACDLRFEHEFVSTRHAQIELHDNSYTVSDLGSTNGTFLNGRRLPAQQPQRLADGDLISLDDPSNPEALQLRYRAGSARAHSYRYKLDTASTILGRAATIQLDHPQVSRQHAQIVHDPQVDQHVLLDLGSTNGTFLNGQPIQRATLQVGDRIQIGVFELVYEGIWLAISDQRGALRAEMLQLSYQIGGQPILHDLTLVIEPCELVAVVGASGAGKSTLLGLISGQLTPSTGRVLLGSSASEPAHTTIGIVPQEEALHRSLPIGRALGYAARLRLPPDTQATEIERRINQALSEVGLQDQRDLPIATLSGGQRRRVAIAAELLADPTLFVLDEPSAGLDPGLEQRLFATLRDLTNAGRTVVVATHATASAMTCDLLAFLAQGRLVFYGPPNEALRFFGVADVAAIYTLFAESPYTNQQETAQLWEQRFLASHYYASYVTNRQTIWATQPDSAAVAPLPACGMRRRQLAALVERTIELMRRDRRNLLFLLLQAPIIGVLLAIVARADAVMGERAAANEAKKVLFMLANTAIWFGVINAARTIAGERMILRHERLTGLQIVPYLGSKIIALLPLLGIQALLLLLPVALKVQFPASGIMFPLSIELFISLLLAGLAGTALGLAISASATTTDRAISLVPLALIPQILFAGVIFSLGDGITAQRVLSWLTISRWAMDALGSSANLNSLPLLPGMLRPLTPAAEYIATPMHLATRWLILIGYAATCLLVASGMLRRAARPRA